MPKSVSSICKANVFIGKKHTHTELSCTASVFACSFILIYTRNVHRLWAAIKQKSCASLDGSSESAHPGRKSVSAVALREHVPACLLSLEVNEVLEYNLEMQVMSNKHFFFCSGTTLLPCNMTGVTGVSVRDCVSFVLVFTCN